LGKGADSPTSLDKEKNHHQKNISYQNIKQVKKKTA